MRDICWWLQMFPTEPEDQESNETPTHPWSGRMERVHSLSLHYRSSSLDNALSRYIFNINRRWWRIPFDSAVHGWLEKLLQVNLIQKTHEADPTFQTDHPVVFMRTNNASFPLMLSCSCRQTYVTTRHPFDIPQLMLRIGIMEGASSPPPRYGKNLSTSALCICSP